MAGFAPFALRAASARFALPCFESLRLLAPSPWDFCPFFL